MADNNQDIEDKDKNNNPVTPEAPPVEDGAAEEPAFTVEDALFLAEENSRLLNQLELAQEQNTQLMQRIERVDERFKTMEEGIRTRADNEIKTAKQYGVAKMAKDMLAIADSFERASAAITAEQRAENPALEQAAQGFDILRAQLRQIFANHGITEIESLGQKFDANRHEGVMLMPPTEEGQANDTIGQVFETGYMLHDRVLRAAKVAIIRR